MKLTVLVDNHTTIDHYYLGEPGLCYYIEDEDSRFLLDTGYSDIYIENARRLGIDLSDLDTIVLSHGHNDHTAERTHRLPKTVWPAAKPFWIRRGSLMTAGVL